MASFEQASEMVHPSVSKSESVSVQKSILPFPNFNGYSLTTKMVSNKPQIEIGNGVKNLKIITKGPTFLIDTNTTPFIVIFTLIMNLSKSNLVDLVKSIVDLFVAKANGMSVDGLSHDDSTFLYLLYEYIWFYGSDIVNTRKFSVDFKVFRSYTKSKDMKMVINKFKKAKFINQYVNILHSLQNNVETDWVFELVFESSSEGNVSARKELKDFFNSSDAKKLQSINTPRMIKILKIIANCLHVKHGFTGDTRETPIPVIDYFNEFETAKYSIDIRILDLPDILGQTIFRNIDVQLDKEQIAYMLQALCYSGVVNLNPNVKEVLETILPTSSFVTRTWMGSSLLMLKITQNMPDSMASKEYKSEMEISALLYYFAQWYNSSLIKDHLSMEKVAEIFNVVNDGMAINLFKEDFQHDLSSYTYPPEKVSLNVILKKTPSSRYFHEWYTCVSKQLYQKGLSGDKVGSLMIDEDVLQDSIGEITIESSFVHESFDQLKSFLTKNGIKFESCILCDESRPLLISEHWKSCNCGNGCDSRMHLCAGCYKQNYNARAEPGHILQLSTISCIQCRSIISGTHTRFPPGTADSDIVDFSNQFYSCCAAGCRNFVHVPPVEGVTCADRPEHIVDTFCVQHNGILGKEIQTMMKPCPGCNHMIFKDEGCNHMTCTNCRTEFCMRPECQYSTAHGETYNHKSYCRAGISDDITVEGLFQVTLRVHQDSGSFGDISRETSLFVSTMLTNIVFLGLDPMIYGSLYELFDYIGMIDTSGPNRVMLNGVLNRLISAINTIYPTNAYFDAFAGIQKDL